MYDIHDDILLIYIYIHTHPVVVYRRYHVLDNHMELHAWLALNKNKGCG